MRGATLNLRHLLDRRAAAFAGAATLAVVAAAATPQLLGGRVSEALERIGGIDPTWVWLAALGFVVSIVGAAGSWRSALSLCGARLSLGDSCARYGTGSLVNSFTPARLGDAVRIGLFSRALGHRDRLWSTGGAFAAIGAARVLVLTVLVAVAGVMGALPLWWLGVLGGMLSAAVLAVVLSRRIRSHGHVVHLLDAFRGLAREPWRGPRIAGWIAFATLGRLAAASAIAASMGVRHPLAAALIIIPALDVAGQLPLTPGNVGVASGAVAMALRAHNVPFTLALSTGIAFHAVETLVGILFGVGSVLALARPSRFWILAAAGAAGCLALVGLGATVLVDLV
jgi:uncharacterized membrane protein YbhN (UPF0104 family)